MFFIPYSSPEGDVLPVLDVGWTLNLEMYFYVLFAIAIAISRRWSPLIVSVAIVAIAQLLPFATDNEALLWYYANPYAYYFVIGIACWYVLGRDKRWIRGVSLHAGVFAVAIVVYVVCVAAGVTPFLIVPALFIVAVLTARGGGDVKSRGLLLLGAASYACYLLHTILIDVMRAVGVPFDGQLVVVVPVLLLSWVVSVIWYETLERWVKSLRSYLAARASTADRTERAPENS